ncbi:enhanced serine sensitivity protein SseB [Candidatus Saccharibacteria bacterium]|nr:enhanced serine sensitivity protein SseB [Candidatus Saccharibacteria bacterium]
MSDINTPVTNSELVAAMEAIQEEVNADTQDAYFEALKNARFLSPVTIEPRPELGDVEEKTTLQAGTKISFSCLTDSSGDTYLPVYTDWPALKQWRDVPDEQTMITSYDDISDMVLKDSNNVGFVINPYSHNIPVRRDVIGRINAGPTSQWKTDKDTAVHIGVPANNPAVLKEAIVNHLKSQKNVKGAWLVLMEKNSEFSFLIVVDFIGDRQAIFNGIASVAVPKLRKGELIDMVPADSDIGRQVIRDYPPFYRSKTPKSL